MPPIPLLAALGVVVLGILTGKVIDHKLKYSPIEVPPLDFGANNEQGSMFDVIAGRYDAINRVLAFRQDVYWRKVMIKKIKSHLTDSSGSGSSSPRILDVATGTADVALMISKMIPTATIVGVDPSQGMLDVGRKKVTRKNKDDKIKLEWADARNFASQYGDNSFDAGTMAFGIRNVPERETALCEIYQVLKPNSLFCILEFSEPQTTANPMSKAAGFFIQKVVPYVGGILSGQRKMYKHLQNSIQNFPAPEEFRAMIDGLQCDDDSGKSFHVEEVEDLFMTFGAVQIYAIKSLKGTANADVTPKATMPEREYVSPESQPEEVPRQEIPVPPIQPDEKEDVNVEESVDESPVAMERTTEETAL